MRSLHKVGMLGIFFAAACGPQGAGSGTSALSNDDTMAQQCVPGVSDPRACDPAATKKTTICHVPPGNPANEHTICVGNSAVPAHLAHGDRLGSCCPTPTPSPEPDGGGIPPGHGNGHNDGGDPADAGPDGGAPRPIP